MDDELGKCDEGELRPRLFIADPLCAFDFGHNAQSLVYFGDYFFDRGFDVKCLVSKFFPLQTGRYKEFKKSFHYYYHEYIPIKVGEEENQLVREGHEESIKRLSKVPKDKRPFDALEAVATADWLEIIQTEELTSKDYIFYPSIDYNGWCGLLRAAFILGPEKTPKIHGRFIGVMENATRSTDRPLRVIRSLLNLADPEKKISLSAEAPVYSSLLEKTFDRDVSVSLYPMKASVVPIKEEEPFLVYSAGAGREDKGFLSLLNIAGTYCKNYPDDNVVFRVQNVREKDEKQLTHYVSQIYAAPNMELIEAIQSDEGMADNYADCHFLIMPYDFETYRLRGSAVFMEGLTKGRPFAISAYTGFHPIVEELDTCYNCTSIDQFCDVIHKYYKTSVVEISKKAASTAQEYEKLSYSGMAMIFPEIVQ